MQTPYSTYSTGQAYGAVPTGTADPIISRLRPRDMMGILDQSFRLYRRHFLTFVAIIAVIHVPIQLLIQAATISMLGPFQSFLQEPSNSRSFSQGRTTELFTNLGLLYVVIFLLGILYWFFLYLAQGALAAGIANSYLDKPVSFTGAYKQMFGD